MENSTAPPANGNNQPQNTAESGKAKRKRVTFDEWIARFRLAFTNGQLPEILPVMQTVGYTPERLKEYLESTDKLVEFSQQQKKEYGEQYAEMEKFEKLRAEIDATCRTHRSLMKIVLKDDVKNQVALRLGERLKTAYGAWEQVVENFYSQIKKSPPLMAQAQTVGITAATVDEALDKLVVLRALKKSHRKELAEAQAATERRDRAFDELYPHYREFIDYARILLADNQLLEMLGIVVKR